MSTWHAHSGCCPIVLATILGIVVLALSAQTNEAVQREFSAGLVYANLGMATGVMMLVTVPFMCIYKFLMMNNAS